MIINNESALRKMHPDYDNEIELIEKVFDYFVKLIDKNLTDYLADNYRIIHKKSYLFSSQLKEIYYNDGTNPDYNVNLAYDYEKNGNIFQVTVNSKAVIKNILPDCPFDKICICPATKNANFNIGNRPVVNIGYSYDGENYILTTYSANFDIFRTLL